MASVGCHGMYLIKDIVAPVSGEGTWGPSDVVEFLSVENNTANVSRSWEQQLNGI